VKRSHKWTRNGLLLALGAGLLVSQAIRWQATGDSDPALITAGTSILLSPLLLGKDEKS